MKLEVLDYYDRGGRTLVIASTMKFRESTMQAIRASAQKICAFAGASASSTRCSHARSTEMERMEKLLAQWINNLNKSNIPITMAIIM